ncbi:alpha/beta hydrolase [Moritella sp.]|uniref:alpha/beta hydrolase n=1 Tax=Moritella sp. TaxID=78556 RepID=UPI0029BFF01B|nr:alpha/beta fold hydrolase [Moritella sp.]
MVFNFIALSIVIQFIIITILIVFDKGKQADPHKNSLHFNELLFDYKALPAQQTVEARDGNEMTYRRYSAQSDTVLILLHGSGWHSQYFLPLATGISTAGLAEVYTPDLRGHGTMPARRGDVDYIDQLEDDLADFISYIRKENPNAKVVVGGHSSGGGLAIRFAGSRYAKLADGYVLLSPFLKYNAPTMRPNSGGWANPFTARIIGLSMLNMMRIHCCDFLTVISFNMPKDARDGTETLRYSHRLNTAYAPRNYKKDLSTITQPILVVAGTADEAFIAEQFEPVISAYTVAQITLLSGVTHMGVVVGPEVQLTLKTWLDDFNQQ